MAATASAPSLPLASPYLIQQDWNAYTPGQHSVWQELVGRRMPQLEEHACQEYLDGFHNIGLKQDHIPNLTEVNKLLSPRTGWNSAPVSGYLPAAAFFEMLAARRFPTTVTIRSAESLEYTPEPDIFHDVCACGLRRLPPELWAGLRRADAPAGHRPHGTALLVHG